MDTLKRKVWYTKWTDSNQRTERVIVGQPDEDLGSDNEIYTRTERHPSGEPATICEANETFTVDDALEAVGFGNTSGNSVFLQGCHGLVMQWR
ncbi:hypothetical protein WMY93_020610 [Mugilogobius chulae]|uniref:Uncharacterized protein n=1 Tax=Mugilogobius chulae TaxID=88201 RepID=A0AAW0NBH4_9GOBI